MNYHLMVDDKFIDSFISTAEQVAPNQNRYIFTFPSPGKYVKSKIGEYAPFGSIELNYIIDQISLSDRVYVHWFSDSLMPYILRINKEIPLYLFFWGGDFLEQPKEFYEFNFEPQTREYWDRLNKYAMFHLSKNPLSYFNQFRLYLTLNKRIETERNAAVANRKLFLQRLNYFCHWNEEDFKRVKKYYNSGAEFKPFFYGIGLHLLPNENENPVTPAHSLIWVGNSATAPNNHLDAFKVIDKFKAESLSVCCPLSYGNKRYGDYVLKEGKKIFSEKFRGLRDYMPIEEYFHLIKNVTVVVMFHNRTQAGGNIFAFLSMGKKVYLKKESSIFSLAQKLGIKIFDANLISGMTFAEFVQPLTQEEKENNRKIVYEAFSEEKLHGYMSELLTTNN